MFAASKARGGAYLYRLDHDWKHKYISQISNKDNRQYKYIVMAVRRKKKKKAYRSESGSSGRIFVVRDKMSSNSAVLTMGTLVDRAWTAFGVALASGITKCVACLICLIM